MLDSPFSRTVYLDCDVYVLSPPLVHHMLTAVLAVADVAMPLDPGREHHLSPMGTSPWLAPASGPPLLCSALIAYDSRRGGPAASLWLGAARRLALGRHPRVRQARFRYCSVTVPLLAVTGRY